MSSPEEFWNRFDDSLERVGFLRQNPDGEDVEMETLRIPLKQGLEWTLFYETGVMDRGADCWRRVADAFQPALAAGINRWGVDSWDGIGPSRK